MGDDEGACLTPPARVSTSLQTCCKLMPLLWQVLDLQNPPSPGPLYLCCQLFASDISHLKRFCSGPDTSDVSILLCIMVMCTELEGALHSRPAAAHLITADTHIRRVFRDASQVRYVAIPYIGAAYA